jgi:hypothetical protein
VNFRERLSSLHIGGRIRYPDTVSRRTKNIYKVLDREIE